jgi:hypothetical protein
MGGSVQFSVFSGRFRPVSIVSRPVQVSSQCFFWLVHVSSQCFSARLHCFLGGSGQFSMFLGRFRPVCIGFGPVH